VEQFLGPNWQELTESHPVEAKHGPRAVAWAVQSRGADTQIPVCGLQVLVVQAVPTQGCLQPVGGGFVGDAVGALVGGTVGDSVGEAVGGFVGE